MKNPQYRQKSDSPKEIDFSNLYFSHYRDHLTQVYNRAFLFRFISGRLKVADQKNYKIALFMVDLDNFKHINDSYGHLVGDKVLKGIAEDFRRTLKKDSCIIRYAGDEFLIILEDITLEEANNVAKNLIVSTRSFSIDVKGKKVTQTTSIGFALFPDDAKNLEELIEQADQALYLVKKRNKDNFAYFKEVNISQTSVKVGLNFFPCRTFINRKKELSLVKKRLEEFSSKSVTKAIIACGESGIGKSRLLQEALEFCQGLGIEVISFNPYQKNSLMPYFLLSKTFNSYFMDSFFHNRQETIDLIKDIPQEKREILSHFLVSIQNYFPPKGNKPQNSAEIADAFLALIKALSVKKGGLFLGVDNSQYADLASLEFFDFILKRNSDLKLFIFIDILDPMPSGIYNPSAITKIVASISSGTSTDLFELRSFTEKDTLAMSEAIFSGIGLFKEFNKILFEITRGQPFFIEELLKYLLEKSVIYFENDKWQIKPIIKEDLPQSLNEVIRLRIESLDLDIKETILLSSVIGEEINPEILSKIKSTNEGDILEILNKAKKLKIIKDEENGFSFLNVAVKEATLKEIPEAQKKGIYNKVSQVLMDSYKDNIETVSFQLANLFNKSEDIQQLSRLSKLIIEKTASMFNAQEVLKYIEDLIKVAEKEEDFFETTVEIESEYLQFASKFLQLFQSAVKDFRLYPQKSKVKEKIVENIFNSLTHLLSKYPVINISEVEKSLVINKRRITPRIAKFVDSDTIVKFLIDREIKSIIFLKNLEKDEISRFFEIIAADSEEIYKQGEWKDILTSQNLTHILVNKAIYLTPQPKTTFNPIQSKLEGTMLADFILGKISGKDLGDLNLNSLIKDNPRALSEEILKASEIANLLDKHTDKIDIIFEGLRRLDDFAKKTEEKPKNASLAPDSKNISVPPQEDLDEKMVNIFKKFDPKTKTNLIRKAKASDQSMISIVKSFDDSSLDELLNEIFSSGMSLWGFNKIISKLTTVYNYPEERLKQALGNNVLKKLQTEEEQKFISEKIQWKNLSLETRITDILKMNEEDLEEISSAEIALVLKELIISENDIKLKELFVYFKDKSLEFPQKVGKKVETVYRDAFNAVYSIKEKNKTVFGALEILLLTIKDKPAEENFNFCLELIVLITTELKFYDFEGENISEKVKIVSGIWKVLDKSKAYSGENSAEEWKKKINFPNIAMILFNLYLENPRLSNKISSSEEAFHVLLFSSSNQITENLAEKLAQITDPFERFVTLNKLKGFLSALKGKFLERFTDAMLGIFSLDTLCDILLSIESGLLSETLAKIYPDANEETKSNIIKTIGNLGLKGSETFLKEIMGEKNTSKLQRLISKAYMKMKDKD